MARVPAGATVCAPEGDTVPCAPAEEVIVYPEMQVPEGRQ